MENVLKAVSSQVKTACLALLGCGLITLCSLVKIPFFPIPFTLQTLAVFILLLTMTPRQALYSTLCYLGCATIGLPVLSGGVAYAFWFLGKSGGYLVAFPLAAYVGAYLVKKGRPLYGLLFAISSIFTLGFLWLLPFFGPTIAWTKGVLLFIPSELLKGIVALQVARLWKR